MSQNGLFPFGGGFVFVVWGFCVLFLLCCFLLLFRVLFGLFVPSLPWNHLLDYVQVHNRSFLWLTHLDGHACDLPIQFPASTNLLNDLAKAMKALDGKKSVQVLHLTLRNHCVQGVRRNVPLFQKLWRVRSQANHF